MAKDISDRKIAVIGAGHMGSALVKGLTHAGIRGVAVSDSSSRNRAVAKRADVIFIAVKPSVIGAVLSDINDVVEGKTIISLAAGIGVEKLRTYLRGRRFSIARIMPNIPVAYGLGVIGIHANDANTRNLLKKLLRGLGLLVEVKRERDLDALTLVSGCGPAIVASLVAMLGKRARALGISRGAEKIALQTFLGAIHHMIRSETNVKQLMGSVATKGGVTEAILTKLRRGGFEKAFARAIKSGQSRLKRIHA